MRGVRMTRWLIMHGDRVTNVVVWDGATEWDAPEGATLLEAPAGVGPGFRLVDGVWVAPPVQYAEPDDEETP
jgi:hypothetical protein